TAGYITRYWSYLLRKAVSAILTNLSPTIDIKRTAGQFLFEGYRDPYIDVSKALPFLFDEFLHDWEKFGWMYKRNGSYEFDGSFNIGSGKRSTFGKLYNWNHWTNTPFFDDPCSKVAESTGQFFERNLGEGFISAFSTDIRRTVFLKYVGKEKVFNILANKYILEDLTLDNGTIYPQNKCYCGGDCVPSGVLNISSIRKTGPLFVSLPHFHRADSYYLNSVEGLRPDKDKHEAFIIIEPTIGVPLEVHLKGQINLLLEPVSGI
ncbi:CD36 domain containing protein, partial [Asbolus verrucosus]